VPVEISPSLIFLVFLYMDFGASPQAALYDVMFLLLVLMSIFLHELGHAFGNLVYGVPVKRVVLYAGGGFCESTRTSTPYEEEFIVAMGPVVTLALWAGAGLIAPFIADPEIAWVFYTLSIINFFLAVLNLMPVLPLDGGKLFYLLLLRMVPASLATRIAGFVELLVALAWVPGMLMGYYFLGFFLLMMPSIPMHWEMLRDG
jgi:Zn-dependent protease